MLRTFTADVFYAFQRPGEAFRHDAQAPEAFKRAPGSTGGRRNIAIPGGDQEAPESTLDAEERELMLRASEQAPFRPSTYCWPARATRFQALSKVTCEHN